MFEADKEGAVGVGGRGGGAGGGKRRGKNKDREFLAVGKTSEAIF